MNMVMLVMLTVVVADWQCWNLAMAHDKEHSLPLTT